MFNDIDDAEGLARSIEHPEALAAIYRRHAYRCCGTCGAASRTPRAKTPPTEVFARAFRQRTDYSPQHATALPRRFWLAGLLRA